MNNSEISANTFPLTVRKRQDRYVEMLLGDGLFDSGYRLPAHYESGDIIVEADAHNGLGGLATRLLFVDRCEKNQLAHSGIPYLGDIVAVEVDKSAKELASPETVEWVQARIRDIYKQDAKVNGTEVA